MTVSEPGDATELCDWCGGPLAQETARYEYTSDPESGQEITLTACGEDHMRLLQQRSGTGGS